ncbi:hypothetical protein G9A89_004135 [Geosiphon pyriformis]|nr:hypothetical protein G9A89_004135 [Geosiphon pyriformis]
MEPVSSSAGGSGSGSTGLGTWSGTKKKVKPEVAGGVVDSSTGLLPAALLHSDDEEHKVSWENKIENDVSSMSGVSDVKNMVNTIAEKTSYAESGEDDEINKATPRKTQTCTYVLGKPLKAPTFDSMSDNENALSLPSPKMFNGSNQMPSVKSRVMEKRSFEPVKSFALDIKVSAVPEKTNVDKSSFTSEISLNKTREMVVGEKILVNDNLRKLSVCSDREVIVKEIPSVFMRKNSVHVALAINDKQMWVLRDQHRTLLYTLSVGTNVHDLSSLLESYGGKTCYIGHNPILYVCDRCTVICFGDEASKLAAIGIILVFKGVSLHWAGLSLASYTHCKQFGHVTVNCSLEKRVVFKQDQIHLAGIYKKKSAPIACPVSFGGKTWAQVAGGSPSHVISSSLVGAGLHFGLVPSSMVTDSPTISHLNDQLAILEHSLELLIDRVSGILVRLESIDLVPVTTFSLSLLPAVSGTLTSNVNSDMIIDTALVSSSTPPSVIHDAVVELSSSSSKVLTAKVGGLETKLIALEASVGLVLDKLNILCSGLGLSKDVICWHKDMNNLISIITETKLKGEVHPWIATRFDGVRVFISGQDSGNLGSGVVIVVNNSLARHVCKISEVPGQLLSIKLLFKNKLSVLILGLYAGASLAAHFSQTSEVNSLIAKTMNESSFVILGGDFNKDGSCRCASFKKCLDLGMVNSLAGNSLAKSPTWKNSRSVVRTIDYVFFSSNLVNAIMSRDILDVSKYFDTDHQVVCVSVGLGGLLDTHLNSLYRQGANESKWDNFKCATLANAAMFSDKFATSIMVLSAGGTFKKKWFKDFDRVFFKEFSKFHKLELLVSKIIKALCKEDVVGFASFMDSWASLDSVKALIIRDLMDSGMASGHVFSAFSSAWKLYRASKLVESQNAKETNIRSAIDKRMESFEVNKDHTIRSVLEHPFRKVVLDHLVVDSELVLELDQVKSKVDVIMEGWTKKCQVVDNMSSEWCRQYWPLEYVFDEAFLEVMCLIGFAELFGVVFVLPDGKAASLSVPSSWKKAWVLMIPKPYKWEGVLTNTRPIALIEIAYKILSKILSDRISAACSTFNVLRGNNFLVLKSTTTQSPIFVIGSVIEDALEKNHEL